jgi:hypothetical protein
MSSLPGGTTAEVTPCSGPSSLVPSRRSQLCMSPCSTMPSSSTKPSAGNAQSSLSGRFSSSSPAVKLEIGRSISFSADVLASRVGAVYSRTCVGHGPHSSLWPRYLGPNLQSSILSWPPRSASRVDDMSWWCWRLDEGKVKRSGERDGGEVGHAEGVATAGVLHAFRVLQDKSEGGRSL